MTDDWQLPNTYRSAAALVPGAQLRVIPCAGHLVHEDRPAEPTAALLDFLGADLRPGPPSPPAG